MWGSATWEGSSRNTALQKPARSAQSSFILWGVGPVGHVEWGPRAQAVASRSSHEGTAVSQAQRGTGRAVQAPAALGAGVFSARVGFMAASPPGAMAPSWQ